MIYKSSVIAVVMIKIYTFVVVMIKIRPIFYISVVHNVMLVRMYIFLKFKTIFLTFNP